MTVGDARELLSGFDSELKLCLFDSNLVVNREVKNIQLYSALVWDWDERCKGIDSGEQIVVLEWD